MIRVSSSSARGAARSAEFFPPCWEMAPSARLREYGVAARRFAGSGAILPTQPAASMLAVVEQMPAAALEEAAGGDGRVAARSGRREHGHENRN